MFAHEPRNWKWMVPAILIVPCLVVGEKGMNVWGWGEWALMPVGLGIVMGVAALLNGWAYFADKWADIYANIRVVQNSTPEVRMMEAAKGMHPDAVKALLAHRRTIWRIKYVARRELVDWVLDEAPNVHAGFVDFVLDHSNGSLMPKHGRLSEGSKQFDPEGLVTDYEQYDSLVLLMQSKLMVTQAYGNQSPKFIPPWTVELLRHRFGVDGEAYGADEGMSEAMMKVVAEQSAVSGQPLAFSGRQIREDVSPVQKESSGQRLAVSNQQSVVEENVPPLNEEVLNAEMERYGSLYANGLPSSLQIKNK